MTCIYCGAPTDGECPDCLRADMLADKFNRIDELLEEGFTWDEIFPRIAKEFPTLEIAYTTTITKGKLSWKMN